MSRNMKLIYLSTFLRNLMFFGAITIPYFSSLAKMSYTQAFFTQSWFQFWIFLLEIPMGVLADKIGRVKTIALGLFLFSIDMVLWGLFPFFAVLLVGEFIGATGAALVSGADIALVYDVLKEEKKENKARKVFSKYEILTTSGRMIGQLVGSLVVGLSFWPYPRILGFPFLMSAVSVTLAYLMLLRVKEPKRVTPEENPIEMGIAGLRKIFTSEGLRSLSIFYTLLSALTFFMFWLYQPLLGSIGVEVKYYGIFSVGFGLFGILLLSQADFISGKVGDRRLLVLLAVASSMLYLLLATQSFPLIVIASIFLLIGAKAVMSPVFNHLANREIESKDRATVLSSIAMMEKLSLVVLYPVVGYLMDRSMAMTLGILGVITLLVPIVVRLKISE